METNEWNLARVTIGTNKAMETKETGTNNRKSAGTIGTRIHFKIKVLNTRQES